MYIHGKLTSPRISGFLWVYHGNISRDNGCTIMIWDIWNISAPWDSSFLEAPEKRGYRRAMLCKAMYITRICGNCTDQIWGCLMSSGCWGCLKTGHQICRQDRSLWRGYYMVLPSGKHRKNDEQSPCYNHFIAG